MDPVVASALWEESGAVSAVPQAIAPLLGAFIVAASGGFVALFVAAAIAAILGGVAVLPIKSVK